MAYWDGTKVHREDAAWEKKSTRFTVFVGFPVVLLSFVAFLVYGSNEVRELGALVDLTCSGAADTMRVTGRWEHGSIRVGETFFLWGALDPYDPLDCARLGEQPECRLSDIRAPFTIAKPPGSDTLTVVKDGRSVPFRVPILKGSCGASVDQTWEEAWKEEVARLLP